MFESLDRLLLRLLFVVDEHALISTLNPFVMFFMNFGALLLLLVKIWTGPSVLDGHSQSGRRISRRNQEYWAFDELRSIICGI